MRTEVRPQQPTGPTNPHQRSERPEHEEVPEHAPFGVEHKVAKVRGRDIFCTPMLEQQVG